MEPKNEKFGFRLGISCRIMDVGRPYCTFADEVRATEAVSTSMVVPLMVPSSTLITPVKNLCVNLSYFRSTVDF